MPLHRLSSDRPVVYDPWRHRFAVALAAAALLLLAVGGMVTGTGSGLSVPDWPLSFGQIFPPMVGGVLYEHGHRLIAAGVGLMTVVLSIWFALGEPRRWVRVLAYLAVGVVVAQGVLGGITVLLRLPVAVSVAHACLAQIFFGLIVMLAVATSRGFVGAGRSPAAQGAGATLLPGAMVSAALVLGQLFLGALMRHSGAGLAIPDVPLAFGRLIPPLDSFEIIVHFSHRAGALLVACAVFWTAARALRAPRRPGLAEPAALAAVLVVVQILLGGTAVLTRLAVVPTTVHLVVGALLLSTLLVLAARAARGAGGALEPRAAPAAAEGAA